MLNKNTGQCQTPPNLGKPENPQPCQDGAGGPKTKAGSPINFTSGNKFQYEADISLVNNFGALTLSRSYNNMDHKAGAFGRGWSSSFLSSMASLNLYDIHDTNNPLPPLIHGWEITTPDGNRIEMRKFGESWFSARSNVVAALFEDNDTWTFKTGGREKYVFGSDGKIRMLINAQGSSQHFSFHTNGELDTISDDFGNVITFTYNNGFVETASVPTHLHRRFTLLGVVFEWECRRYTRS